MASIKYQKTKSKKKKLKKLNKTEIVLRILKLKKEPLTTYNKLRIQHLQQKLDIL